MLWKAFCCQKYDPQPVPPPQHSQVHDPASGEVLARVTHAKAVETKAAIAEASSVFGMWSAKSGLERSNILRR